jgi:hypothetical protein
MAAEARKYRMSIGLKNAGEILENVTSIVQFAVNEQCVQYGECSMYSNFTSRFHKPVFHIEYPKNKTNDNTTISDVKPWCEFSKEENNTQYNIENFSTVVKNLNLDGWVEYCDNSTAITELTDPPVAKRVTDLSDQELDTSTIPEDIE